MQTTKASRRVKLSMNKLVSLYFSTGGKFNVEINTERLHTVPMDIVCISCFWSIFI